MLRFAELYKKGMTDKMLPRSQENKIARIIGSSCTSWKNVVFFISFKFGSFRSSNIPSRPRIVNYAEIHPTIVHINTSSNLAAIFIGKL